MGKRKGDICTNSLLNTLNDKTVSTACLAYHLLIHQYSIKGSIKGQVRCVQTLTPQVEEPSLETSKFSLYFSCSCIPINPKLSYIFSQNF
jgi:hypothetical protein